MIQPQFVAGEGGTCDAKALLILTAEQAWDVVERICDPMAESPQCTFRKVGTRVGQVLSLAKLRRYLMDFGLTGRFRIHTAPNGRSYVILLGDPVIRQFMKGTRYLMTNPKVLELAVGMRSFVRRAVNSVSKLKVGILAAGITLDLVFGILEGGDLWSEVPKQVLKTVASAVASSAVSSLVAGAGFAFWPVAAGVVVGIAVSYGFDMLDSRFHISQRLGDYLHGNWTALEDGWRSFEFEATRTYRGIEDWIVRQAMPAW